MDYSLFEMLELCFSTATSFSAGWLAFFPSPPAPSFFPVTLPLQEQPTKQKASLRNTRFLFAVFWFSLFRLFQGCFSVLVRAYS